MLSLDLNIASEDAVTTESGNEFQMCITLDLPDCLVPPVQAKIFADDTKLYATHSSDSSSPLSLSLSNFCMWSETWQLNIAFQKCSVISFGHNSASNSYSLGGVLLNRVFDICDLGVHITSDFKPSLHCASIAAKAFQRCSLLLKGLQTLNISTLCQVFTSYVRPILEYNTLVWNPWLIQDIKCVERVQRFFTRAVFVRVKLPTMSYTDRLANHIEKSPYISGHLAFYFKLNSK